MAAFVLEGAWTSRLRSTPLQLEILDGLAPVPGFYLTGGAALGAFYLGHRRSFDLDLFSDEEHGVDIVGRALLQLGEVRGWQVVEVVRAPAFRRYIMTSEDDETVVDVVHEPVRQVVPVADKPLHGALRIDALADLVSNKLCALLGRADVKDLVDLYFLDQQGIDVLAFFDDAAAKDGGMEPTMLAYVLTGMAVDPTRLLLLRSVTSDELAAYRDHLAQQLLLRAWPESDDSASGEH